MSYAPRTKPSSAKAVLDALQRAAARHEDPQHSHLQGITTKALLACSDGITPTLRKAMGTLALAELIGIRAAKQITTETTWYHHRDELRRIGIELAIRKGKQP